MLKQATWILFVVVALTGSPAAAQLSYSVSVGGPRYYVVEPAPAVVRPMWGRPVYVGRRGYYYARPMPVYVERPIAVAPPVVAPPVVAPQVKPVPQPQRVAPPKPAPLVQASKQTPTATTVSSSKKSVAQPVSQVEMEPLLTPLEDGATIAEKPVPQPPSPGPIVTEPVQPVVAVPIRFKGKLPEGPTAPFTCTHAYTGTTFEIQIPASLTIREINQGKRSIEIEFDHGEVNIRFHRDGSATVDYDF